MSRATTVTIEHLELKRSDLTKVKQLFKIKDNVEAIQKALDMASGKIELETVFKKFRGTKIEKVYASETIACSGSLDTTFGHLVAVGTGQSDFL